MIIYLLLFKFTKNVKPPSELNLLFRNSKILIVLFLIKPSDKAATPSSPKLLAIPASYYKLQFLISNMIRLSEFSKNDFKHIIDGEWKALLFNFNICKC